MGNRTYYTWCNGRSLSAKQRKRITKKSKTGFMRGTSGTPSARRGRKRRSMF